MSSYGVATPGPGYTVEAVVKWFNLTKGFGFVAPADGSADAFMHMSVLSRAGLQQVEENTKLLVEIGDGQKGRQVLRIVQILGSSEPMSYSAPAARAPSIATGPSEEATGTVKWFKEDKGFGFASTDDGGKDVFIHKNVILDAGLRTLDPGQKIKMKIQTASKGREAVSIWLL